MCNINLIYKKDKVKTAKTVDIMNKMSFYSFLSNRDGEGFIDSDLKIHKSDKKLYLTGEDYFIVGHQRLSTSGSKDMLHPHESDNFLMMHNGIFYGISDKNNSDSRIYLNKLEEKYVLLNYDIKKALTEIHKEINGSYSIVLYEKKNNRWLYYKNNKTSFYMFNSKNYMIASTKKENVDMVLLNYINEFNYENFNNDFKRIFMVKSDIVYNLLTMKKLFKLKSKEIEIKSSSYGTDFNDEHFYQWFAKLNEKRNKDKFYNNELYNYY